MAGFLTYPERREAKNFFEFCILHIVYTKLSLIQVIRKWSKLYVLVYFQIMSGLCCLGVLFYSSLLPIVPAWILSCNVWFLLMRRSHSYFYILICMKRFSSYIWISSNQRLYVKKVRENRLI